MAGIAIGDPIGVKVWETLTGYQNTGAGWVVDLEKRLSNMALSDPSTRSSKQLIAVAKYGFERCEVMKSIIGSVPNCWSETIRLRFVKELDPLIDQELVSAFSSDKLLPTAKQAYLGPPTGNCLECKRLLQCHNNPVRIIFYGQDGKTNCKYKVTLRCPKCKINYGFDKYGNKTIGYQFYEKQRDAVPGNDSVIFDRRLIELHCGLSQHCWVSFQGFAEAWKDVFSHSIKDAFDRRVYADAFWWAEVEAELRETSQDFQFFCDDDREKCMAMLDTQRQQGLYPHPSEECHKDCKARGCGKLWITDGIWKTQFAHCMWNMKVSIENIPLINLPNVCTNETRPGKAFCDHHSQLCEQHKPPIPTGLQDFIKYSGGTVGGEDAVDEDGETDDLSAYVASSSRACEGTTASNCISEQGGQEFLRSHKNVLVKIDDLATETSTSRCNKDLGARTTLRKMSRGHQFIVRAGGHIDMWTPLYQSESVGQVYLIIIAWMYLIFKDIPSNQWNKHWLAYDNMCQLTKLKASKHSLPLPVPYNSMWQQINKIIDCLHVKNHIDPECQTILHPDNFVKMYPELKGTKNTQAGEQTFVWLSRFKKIVCSMPKLHHLFFIHRMVKRRNIYNVKCYAEGRKPLLPSIRNSKSN